MYGMKKITIYITNEQYKRLREIAKQTEVSMSEQIRRYIQCCLDKK